MVKIRRRKTIVAGDINAKAKAWGWDIEDAKGTAFGEWAARNDLAIVNKGRKPTL